MASQKAKESAQFILKQADIEINGKRPWDIQVNNSDFYSSLLAGGSLALGESYMDGWWDCQAIDQMIAKILRAQLDKKVSKNPTVIANTLKAKLFNQQSRKKARVVGQQHYDVGNDLYRLMLDQRMNYSCGYWKDASNLDEAQEAKLDLICRKLKLKPGMTLLDIGCGWGSMANFAAENYQVKVVGITISKEQAKLATQLCDGLDIEIRLQDYRDVTEKYDRIVSIGMFEHVGYKNYREYMQVVDKCLKDDGIFLLHTIGGSKSVENTDPWIEKYIFPNSMLPSASQITRSAEGCFNIQDWHNFPLDYAKTLREWYKNFNANWDKIKDNYDERFFRMWNYYLLCCIGTFTSGDSQLWQIVFTKQGAAIGYESER